MRRMDYCRFANPVNFGEYDDQQNAFVLDKNIEDGIYLLVIKDGSNSTFYSSILVNLNGDYYNGSSGIMADLESGDAFYLAMAADRKHLTSISIDGDTVTLALGDIIYLYKLN